jgi:hypothetical protein
MKKTYIVIFIISSALITGCSSVKIFTQFELVEKEKKGYSILLDSTPIQLANTYLNNNNIQNIKHSKYKKRIEITRKDKNKLFHSIDFIKTKNKYNSKIDWIVVNNMSLDSLEITRVRFEDGAIKDLRLLTQKDYSGPEFDSLASLKKTIGNGMLIIKTE